MRAVRADREIELEQQLVGDDAFRVVGASHLTADLAELTRPVREKQGPAVVVQRAIRHAPGMVEARARIPAPRELILAKAVVAERVRASAQGQILTAPDELRAKVQTLVDRALQRPVPVRRIKPNQVLVQVL